VPENSDVERTKVRTTMQPDREIEVDEYERIDLERQGLLQENSPEARPARQNKNTEE
jgi:hypothetical protein